MLVWIKDKLSQIERFSPNMLSGDSLKDCINFLVKDDILKIYFWTTVVDENNYSFHHSLELPPESVLHVSDRFYLYFLKIGDTRVKLTPQNIDTEIREETINYGDNMKSLMNFMTQQIIPSFLKDKEWPSNIKKDFLDSSHRFLTEIRDEINRREDKIKLYIPQENYDDPNLSPHEKKDMTHRLEAVLINWNSRIKELLNVQMSQTDSDNAGPIDEINQWRKRKDNLMNIQDQIGRPDVQKVLEIVNKTFSTPYDAFIEISKQIEVGATEAEDNLKYLSILEAPCLEMSKGTPLEIPKILPTLLNCVRVIWEKSTYYNTEERISGLLRRISNEIIKQCREYINLDDMFNGNVEKCIQDLKDSKQCGALWKSIYPKYSNCISKFSDRPWKFKTDSIFAQIDAFIQRCNDLIDICKGQIQFARKGRKFDLPMFSGTKGPEIIAVLDEIRDTFNNYLNNIRGSNQDKILDIKSTKWHDDYNVFKNGMKNLDNGYINLINFAFDNVNTLQQGVEYLEGFDDLAKRDSIKAHVEKQIDKVNELFLQELRIAEQSSKREIAYCFGTGEFSGNAIWIKSLIVRIEKLKKQYDQLVFIPEKHRRLVNQDYNNVDKNLRESMMENARNFKAYVTQVEDAKRLQIREKDPIFTESDKIKKSHLHHSKETKPIVIDSKAEGKGHIESNFDHSLLRIIIEGTAFKKLAKDGISNFSQNVDDYVNVKREILRVCRENAMLAIRKYNMIYDSMTSFEKELFSTHLKLIEARKARGKETIKWSNNLETFVGQFNATCDDVYAKLLEFKEAGNEIDQKCREIAKLHFVVFDNKEPYELEKFKKKQYKNKDEITRKLVQTFTEIRAILKKTYRHFIDQEDHIQKNWFSYVIKVDEKIESELRKAVRNSFQTLLKAMTGDEANNTNPVQLFKIYIMIEGKKDDFELIFQPNPEELGTEISTILKNCMNPISHIQRLESDMLEIRSQGIAEILKEDLGNPAYAAGGQQIHNFSETNDFLLEGRENIDTLLAAISQEGSQIIVKITTALANHSRWLNEYMSPWKNEQIKQVWSSAKEEYFNEMYKTLHVNSFKEQVEFYDMIQNEIQVERHSTEMICIYVDTTKIRERIQELIAEAQKNQLEIIKVTATSHLEGLYNEFEEAKRRLRPEPRSLEELDQARRLWKEKTDKKVETEAKIAPLEEVFKLLDDYILVGFKKEEMKLRNGLREAFEEYCSMLDKIRLRNENSYMIMKAAHDAKLNDFNKEVQQKKNEDFDKNAPYAISKGDLVETVETALRKLETYKDKTDEFREMEEKMQFGFELFDMNYMPPPELEQMETKIEELKVVWMKKAEWDAKWDQVKPIKFIDISWDDISSMCDQYLSGLKGWKQHIQEWGISMHLKNTYELLKLNMPIVELLRRPSIRPRHWDEVKKLVGDQFDQESQYFDLEKWMKLSFDKHHASIENLVSESEEQYKIEMALKEIKDRWIVESLDLVEFKSSEQKMIFVINGKSADKVNEKLEEDLLQLTTMKSSVHAEQFVREIEEWEHDLNRVLETIDVLMVVQRKMIYFSNIFRNIVHDLAQLSGDVNSFREVENRFGIQLERISHNNNVKASLTIENIKEKFESMNNSLDITQKNMRAYLKQKRIKFPRFYFLSDEDMFEMLGKAKDPDVVNKHMKKMFEGIKSLQYERIVNKLDKSSKTYRFKGMMSSDGEYIEFEQTIEATGDLISMMNTVEDSMKDELKRALKNSLEKLEGSNMKALKNSGPAFNTWMSDIPGQMQIASIQIEWTLLCQTAIAEVYNSNDKKKEKEVKEKGKKVKKDFWRMAKERIDDYVVELPKLIKNFDKRYIKLRIESLIVIQVYHRDVIENLEGHVQSDKDFEWTKYLRFVREEGPSKEIHAVRIEQGNAHFYHGWEYQGNNGRLVMTPLTDRCYLTLTNAMHFKRGGAPQGPAGTGKTETVKDLGKNLGIFVFVYNCSEGLEVKSLKSMFEGFAMTGSWGCFDEFNRIEIDVLSVVAIQINAILDALSQIAEDQELGEVLLDDDKIPLRPTCSVFITMNPGYAGRTELPDNLKALFRPISMMVPDMKKICEITLRSLSFTQSDELAKKIETLYELMGEQLSQQDHYAFGLRAIKAVLNLAGRIKNAESSSKKPTKDKNELNPDRSMLDESRILIRAIRDTNDPILVKEDEELFMGLLKDLFPEQKIDSKKDRELTMQIHQTFFDKFLENSEYAINKVTQLYNSMITRHGNMLVGKTMSGKTTTYQCLADTLKSLNEQGIKDQNGRLKYQKVRTYVLNPKAIDMQELYGYYNPETETSEIGVFSYLMDQLCNKDETEDDKWIIFDGPIDTKWIESMNSLLDDNKVLTLLDGNRINLSSSVKLLFEVEDLAVASPATVSRCGMIYLDVKSLDWDALRLKWLLTKEKAGYDEESLDTLEEFFDKWVGKVFDKYREGHLEYEIPLEENSLVDSLCKLIDAVAIPKNGIDYNKRDELFWIKYEKWFIFAVIWTIGAGLKEESRKKFDSYLRDIEGVFPLSQTVYDCYINVEKNEFVKWEDRLTKQTSNWTAPHSTPDHRFLVETIDTMRTRQMIELAISNGINLLLMGKTGTGKTAIVNSKLNELDDGFCYNVINLSANTSSQKLQQIVESKLIKPGRRVFRPPGGKNAVIFIDDLNMPKLDEFGSQAPIELLRQYIEYEGWYDRGSLDTFVTIKNTALISAMGPPGGGRNSITQRITSKYQVLNIATPQDSQIKRIFSSILHYKMSKFDGDEIKANIDKATDLILDFYKNVTSDDIFKPTPVKSHYMFNLRDMSRVVQGVTLVDKDSCDSLQIFLKLLIHENFRVYRDRMINWEDRDHMKEIMRKLIDMHFQRRIEEVLEEKEGEDNSKDMIFVNFLSDNNTSINIYGEVTNLDLLKAKLESQLVLMNEARASNKLDTVFFKDAMMNCCKINRILNLSNGHGLLIGEGGSGRHSLTRIAAHIAGYKIFQIQITKNFNSAQFKSNMKELFEKIVKDGKPTVFLFSENEITSEAIIEDVNNILSLGEIPNLYKKKEGKDEFSSMKQILEKKMEDESTRITEEKLYDKFLSIIQANLHLIFCIGQSGDSLRLYGRQYPGLINNTTQIWFDDWPKEALRQVARNYLDGRITLDKSENIEESKDAKEDEDGGHKPGKDEDSDDESEEDNKEVDLDEQKRLKEEADKAMLNEKINRMADFFGNVHASAVSAARQMKAEVNRTVYITPKNFIDFVKEYLTMMDQKKEYIFGRILNYEISLGKLKEAQETVQTLRKDLGEKKFEMNRQQQELAELVKDLSRKTKIVNTEKSKQGEKNSLIQIEKDKADDLKAKAEETRITKLQPVLDKAMAQVEELTTNTQEFNTVKELARKEHKDVMVAMKPIMVLIDETPTNENIIKVITKNFLQKVKNMARKEELERIDKKKFKLFESKMKDLPHSYKQISSALDVMREFLSAIQEFIKANFDIIPILDDIRDLTMKVNLMESELEAGNRNLRKMEEETEELERKKKENEENLRAAEAKIKEFQTDLEIASSLVGNLGHSQESWTNKMKNLKIEFKKIEGDILMTMAFLNYSGPFTSHHRRLVEDDIRRFAVESKLPHTVDWDFVSYHGVERDLLEWSFAGLPSDKYSQENAVIVMSSQKWPLMIDPQSQANKWLKKHFKVEEGSIMVISPTTAKYMDRIKTALEMGIKILFQDITDDVDPSLNPVLDKFFTTRKGKKMILFGEQQFPYNDNFQLFMTTRLQNPVYKPEVTTKVSLVNFSVKEDGLEEQLLETLIKIMNQKLEDTRVECILKQAQNETTLLELEEDILNRLRNVSTELHKDVELNNVLQTCKETQDSAHQILASVKSTLEKNKIAREIYRPLGKIASQLYFTISSLSFIDHMYQFSLDSFVNLFKDVITKKKDERGNFSGEVVKEKIEKIDIVLRKEIYEFACQGIFEKDKLLLSLMMAKVLAPIDQKKESEKDNENKGRPAAGKRGRKRKEEEENEVQDSEKDYYDTYFKDEWNFFLKGGVVLERENQPPNPDPSWISTTMWDNITELEKQKLFNFAGIVGSFTHSTKEWRRYYTYEAPESEALYSDWESKIKGFSLLVLLRAIRPDRIPFAARTFVQKTIGNDFVQVPNFDIEDIYKKTSSLEPVLFILSPGSNPWTYLEMLANKKDVSIVQISLGQGQSTRAKEKIKNGRKEGQWVYLANIHLSTSFLKELEVIIEVFTKENTHDNFRLFLSANPSDRFPISILQNSLKVTTEPPRGIKKNMLKIYNNIVPDYFPEEDGVSDYKKYLNLLFALTWFHSIVVERKKFNTLGWNVMYDFNDSDFIFSERLIRGIVRNSENDRSTGKSLQWDAIRYIISEVNYGGRVTDDWDRRLLKQYSDELFQEGLLDSEIQFVLSELKPEYKVPRSPAEDQRKDGQKKTGGVFINKDIFKLYKDFYKKEIKESFPNIESPAIFGNHGNAEISSQRNDADRLLNAILMMQPSDVSSRGETREESVLKNVTSLQEKVPELIDIIQVRLNNRSGRDGNQDPLKIVLIQEVSRFNKVLTVVKASFEEMIAALKGQTLVSEAMEEMIQNFYDNKVPSKWKFAYHSVKPLSSWVNDLKERISFFKSWAFESTPLTFWLGGFTFPTGFTTALKQKTARVINKSIHTLKWEYTFTKSEVTQHPREGAYLRDIFIEGARWSDDDA